MSTSEERYKDVALNKYKDGYNFYPSEKKDYILCSKELTGNAQNPANHIDFFVYDLRNEKIIFEKSIDNGKVGWFGDHQVEVLIIPGTMAEGQTLDNYTKVYDLETGEIAMKSELINKKR